MGIPVAAYTPGYYAAHKQVAKLRGTPSHCEDCGTTDPSKRYEWASISKNYTDPNDYKRLCKACHAIFDEISARISELMWAGRSKDKCIHGHLYDAENTGYYPSGKRYCRTCHRARVKRAAVADRTGHNARRRASAQARRPVVTPAFQGVRFIETAVAGYYVGDDGHVYSDKAWQWGGRPAESRRRLSEVLEEPRNYLRVRLTLTPGHRQWFPIHNLVAVAFLPLQPSPLHEIGRHDGDQLNNRADNLFWGTQPCRAS